MGVVVTADAPGGEDRRGFYRGPAHGDGRRRRSDAWMRAHDEALTRDCSYVLRTRKPTALGGQLVELRCGAEVGIPCRDPRSGHALQHQPAHLVRLSTTYVPHQEASL